MEYQIAKESENPKCVALLLHGRGSDEEDLLPMAGLFGPEAWTASLRAPYPFGPGYAWYGLRADGGANVTQFKDSVESVSQLIDQIYGRFLLPVFLLGFSQGGLMAAQVALERRGEDLAGILVLSAPPSPAAVEPGRLANFPVFWAHGLQDPVVTWDRGQRMRETLESSQADLSSHSYPMGHMIVNEEIDDMRRWLGQHSGRN